MTGPIRGGLINDAEREALRRKLADVNRRSENGGGR